MNGLFQSRPVPVVKLYFQEGWENNQAPQAGNQGSQGPQGGQGTQGGQGGQGDQGGQGTQPGSLLQSTRVFGISVERQKIFL